MSVQSQMHTPFPIDEAILIQKMEVSRTDVTTLLKPFMRSIEYDYPATFEFLAYIAPKLSDEVLSIRYEWLLWYFAYMKQELKITAKVFFEEFNRLITYRAQHAWLEYLEEIVPNVSAITIADCHTLRTKYLDKSLKNTVHIFVTDHDLAVHVDNLLLRCYLAQAQGGLPIIDGRALFLTMTYKISYLDFNDEILVELSLQQLRDLAKENPWCSAVTREECEYVLLDKLQRIDKVYVIDNSTIEAIKQLDEATLAKQNLLNNNLLDLLMGTIEYVNSESFRSKARHIVSNIIEELSCIDVLVRMNQEYLDTRTVSADSIQYIVSTIAAMSHHQRCLMKQVLYSTAFDHSDIPKYEPKLREIAETIFNTIGDTCETYLGVVRPCDHSTFSFYAMHKWFDAFCQMFLQAHQGKASCDHGSVQNLNTQTPVIYPRRGFCSGCHAAYHRLQELNTRDADTARSGMKFRFFVMIVANQVYLYRIRFADKCDIQLHSSQVGLQNKRRINLISNFLKAIEKEKKMLGVWLRSGKVPLYLEADS